MNFLEKLKEAIAYAAGTSQPGSIGGQDYAVQKARQDGDEATAAAIEEGTNKGTKIAGMVAAQGIPVVGPMLNAYFGYAGAKDLVQNQPWKQGGFTGWAETGLDALQLLGFKGATSGLKRDIISGVRSLGKTQQGKRVAEILMRNDVEGNPVEAVKSLFSKNNKNYIKTGVKSSDFPNIYSGGSNVDMVNAYLYGTSPNPKYFTEVSGYGPHTSYVEKFYPNAGVKVYEVKPSYTAVHGGSAKPVKDATVLETLGDDGTIYAWNANDIGPSATVDVGGYLFQKGVTGQGSGAKFVARQQDIWKFNPKEYIKKYNLNSISHKLFPINEIGLNFLDAAGTPVIIRTPWQTYDKTIHKAEKAIRESAAGTRKTGGKLNYLNMFK